MRAPQTLHIPPLSHAYQAYVNSFITIIIVFFYFLF